MGIITQPSETDNASFHIIYDVGSQVESKGYRGISHYLEHNMFQDVEKYLQEYENKGITYNASSGALQVIYYLEGLDDILNPYIYDYANGIVNCIPSKERFEQERSIIMKEYNMSFNDRSEQMDLNIYRNMFNSYCPIGSAEDIENITYEDFLEFREKYYSKPTKIIYTSKNFQLDESRFDFEMSEPEDYYNDVELLDEIKQDEGFDVEISQDYSEQDNCNLNILTDKVIEEDFPKINFINKLIAGSLTSPLYQIREKYGLAYDLGLYLAPINYKQAINTFYIDCDYADVELVEEKYFEIISSIKDHITQDMIEKARSKQIINERKIAIDLYKIPDYNLYPEWNDKTFLETITVEEIHNLIDKYYLDTDYICVNDKELYQK